MRISCDHCEYVKEVDDSYAGRRFQCPRCAQVSRAPDLVTADTVAETSLDETAFDRPAIDENERSSGEYDTLELAEPEPVLIPSDEIRSDLEDLELPLPANYEIRRGLRGLEVHYLCPNCVNPLHSSLDDAGGNDNCPECGAPFIVPGTKERMKHAEARAAEAERTHLQRASRFNAAHLATVNRTAEQNQREKDVQLDRDPVREWLIYTAVILVLLGVATGKHMIYAFVYDESLLCLVIIALFVIGLLCNLRGVLRLRNEYVCAAVCMQRMKDEDGLAAIVADKPAGVLHQHIHDLANIARYDDSVSQDSLITLLYSRMMSYAKLVDVLSGVLVSLGLIGTIVGLISMTNGLSVTLDSLSDAEHAGSFLAGLRTTMSGLGTAFYTTLVGAILGSVALRVLNNVYTSNVDRLVTYVASKTEVSILPKLKRDAAMGAFNHEVA